MADAAGFVPLTPPGFGLAEISFHTTHPGSKKASCGRDEPGRQCVGTIGEAGVKGGAGCYICARCKPGRSPHPSDWRTFTYAVTSSQACCCAPSHSPTS